VTLAVWKNDVLGFYIELASVSLPAAGLALTMTILVFFCDGSWGAGGCGLVSSDGVKNSPPCKMVLIFCHFRTCLLEGFSHCALNPRGCHCNLVRLRATVLPSAANRRRTWRQDPHLGSVLLRFGTTRTLNLSCWKRHRGFLIALHG
jgi:hypothetical protein